MPILEIGFLKILTIDDRHKIKINFILKFRDIPLIISLIQKSLEVSYITFLNRIIFSVKCFKNELFFSMLKVATN